MEGLCVIWGRGDQIPFLGPDCGDHQQGFWCLPRAPHMQVPQTQAHSPPFQHAYPPNPLRAARGQAHSPEPSPPTWGLVLPRRHRVITGERGLRPPEEGHHVVGASSCWEEASKSPSAPCLRAELRSEWDQWEGSALGYLSVHAPAVPSLGSRRDFRALRVGGVACAAFLEVGL